LDRIGANIKSGSITLDRHLRLFLLWQRRKKWYNYWGQVKSEDFWLTNFCNPACTVASGNPFV